MVRSRPTRAGADLMTAGAPETRGLASAWSVYGQHVAGTVLTTGSSHEGGHAMRSESPSSLPGPCFPPLPMASLPNVRFSIARRHDVAPGGASCPQRRVAPGGALAASPIMAAPPAVPREVDGDRTFLGATYRWTESDVEALRWGKAQRPIVGYTIEPPPLVNVGRATALLLLLVRV